MCVYVFGFLWGEGEVVGKMIRHRGLACLSGHSAAKMEFPSREMLMRTGQSLSCGHCHHAL